MTNYEELSHHGIKGQKWGVRNFQNPDGSLTAKGRKRYLKNTTTKSKPKTGSKSGDNETVEQKKERILRSKSVKDLYDNTELFDNKELQDAYVRKKNERGLADLIPQEKSKFDKAMTFISEKGTLISNAANGAKDAYENGKKLLETLGIITKDKSKKDESKKDESKKDESKKDESKKDEPKKDEPKKDEPKKDEPKNDKTESSTDESNNTYSNSADTARRMLESGRKIAGLIETTRSVAGLLGGGSSKTGPSNTTRSLDSGKSVVSGYLTSGYGDIPVDNITTAIVPYEKRD